MWNSAEKDQVLKKLSRNSNTIFTPEFLSIFQNTFSGYRGSDSGLGLTHAPTTPNQATPTWRTSWATLTLLKPLHTGWAPKAWAGLTFALHSWVGHVTPTFAFGTVVWRGQRYILTHPVRTATKCTCTGCSLVFHRPWTHWAALAFFVLDQMSLAGQDWTSLFDTF